MIGQEDRYIEDLTQEIQDNPNDSKNYYQRGREYHNQRKYNLAITDLTKAVELRCRELSDAYQHRGNAIELLSCDLSDAYQHRGNAYRRKGDYDNAIADYTLAIEFEIRRDDKISYFHRGESYVGQGNCGRAILDFTKAIKLVPGQPYYLEERGKAYHADGNYDQAIADFTEALGLRDTPDLWANGLELRGEAHLAKGDHENAEADFRQAEFFRNIAG